MSIIAALLTNVKLIILKPLVHLRLYLRIEVQVLR